MYKKKKSTLENNKCPICDGIIWGRGQKVLIEGAKITVCQNCAQYGKKILSPPKKFQRSGSISNKGKIAKPYKASPSKNILEPSIEIVPDFAKKIRSTRTGKKLTQEQFAAKLNEKPSLIRRIESGKVKPTIKLAQKMEKVYNIKLLRQIDEIKVDTKKYMKRSSGNSLGDIAFIKKKR
jgi:putative transcription factor